MERKTGIYAIISPSNRVYIGSAHDLYKRKRRHFYELKRGTHSNPALKAAWAKYGDELRFTVIEHCEVDKLIEREQWWIDNHALFWGRMYNASSIAGRPEHTEEVRRKISEAHKGRKLTPEHIEKVRVTSTGRLHTKETKQKISASSARPEMVARLIEINKTRVKTPEEIERTRALGLSHKGKRHTDDTRAKMSASQQKRYTENPYPTGEANKITGTKRSEETKRRMSEAAKKRWADPAQLAKKSASSQAQRLREHMARLNWIVGGIFEPLEVGTV